jgi:hypothetical protein
LDVRENKYMQSFGRKTSRKKPQVRTMHRWENNIRMDCEEVNFEGVVWICLVHDQSQNLVNQGWKKLKII